MDRALDKLLAYYTDAPRRVREARARHELGTVLHWAFSADDVAALPEDGLEEFLSVVMNAVDSTDLAWAAGMGRLEREMREAIPVDYVRSNLAEAFATIRRIAQDVDVGAPPTEISMTVRFVPRSQSNQTYDAEGRPRWGLDGRLADALVWMAIKLFSEVSRSLIRSCGVDGCERIYVATKNQRYCPAHQREARRQTQRRAERAFRARQRAAKTKRRKR